MEKVKRLKVKDLWFLGALLVFPLLLAAIVFADDTPAAPEQTEQAALKSELDNLKVEWEAVREQQIQMIRGKEDQLEKLKEEIFAKMKTLNVPATLQSDMVQPEVLDAPGPVIPVDSDGVMAPGGNPELEAQKAALQAERQKFFREMSRQKTSLRQLQSALDEKTKQLEAERERFEQEKKAAVS